MSRLTPLLAGIAFPLLAHASALAHDPEWASLLALLALACLGLLLLWPLRGRPALFFACWAALLALIGLLAWRGGAHLPLMLPPVLFPAAMGFYFARTLGGARKPLIEALVQLLHGGEPLDDAIRRYARRLTAIWALLLFAMAGWSLWLALMAEPDGLLATFGVRPPWPMPLAFWSLFANLLNYLLIATFFVLEYVFRRYRFPQQPYDGFGDFLGRIVRLGPSIWRELAR